MNEIAKSPASTTPAAATSANSTPAPLACPLPPVNPSPVNMAGSATISPATKPAKKRAGRNH